MIRTTTPLPAPRWWGGAAAVLVLGLTVAGCTGGDDPPDGSDTPTAEVLGSEPGATITGTPEPLPTQVTPSETLPSATLTGGGQSGASGSGGSAPDVTYEVRVTGGRASPAPTTVELAPGQTLRVVLWSDRATEIHAHGFEVEMPVPAKASVPLDVVAGDPGVYVIESHDPDLVLLQVAVG